ncbi:Glu-tRNA(Gln) amidotransferase subunit GatE [Natronomonas amylolytica]|uniref:Glu-tRNA(Gln) amidotransferase subunit GatE n=1 Tax=Natronomonas amylolytica TaxID=3108498 RepID=UPI0030098998
MSYDYDELGLVAGLEIHQQLDTATKLFCNCPTERREPEESARSFSRYLHPTKSELGELDEAALEESRVDREFEYLAFDTTCLVEEDDEPPHRLDSEALDTAMEIASLLDCEVVDQAHVMRKIVVDGSNTSGFQRSSLIATDGEIETDDGPVGIADMLLEEESAARIEEHDAGVTYGLDRLGIPLVEIGTKPDIRSPEQALEAAERIGMLLRSTGKVKRGLGTIRQDVNVSIAEGARVEMKGVQSLEDIDDLVENEVGRQVALLDIAEELQERDAAVAEPQDVSEVFADTDSGVISGAEAVTAVRLEGFDGLVGREIQPDRRLGTELSDHAKRHGAGGIFHTDELPAYGVTEDEVEALREAVDAREAPRASDGASGDEPRAGDAVALVAADADVAEGAIEAVADRAEVAIEEVPEETRGANEDGTSRYLRPLPGAARMYPETDVPPVEPDLTDVEPPELLTEKVQRYQADLGLGESLAEQVAYGRFMTTFEEAVDRGIDPTTAAGTLESTLTELRRDDVPVENLTEDHLLSVLELVEDGDLPNEGINPVLTALAEEPSLSAEEAIEEAGLGGVSREDVREVVVEVVERNAEQIEAEGMGAFSGLMGECMGQLRGKADGEVVSELLREEIGKRT